MGVEVGFVFGSLVVAVASAVLLGIYAKKDTPWYVHLCVFIGWFLSFFVVILLPLDVDMARYESCISEFHLKNNSTDVELLEPPCSEWGSRVQQDESLTLWRVLYWTMYFLTWAVYPLLQGYTEAGEFTVGGRLIASLKENLLFYAICGLIGGGCMIYLAVALEISSDGLKGIAMASANAYGLFANILFLGYGLVEIPRGLWYTSNLEIRLNQYEFRAIALRKELDETSLELHRTLGLVTGASTIVRSKPDLYTQMEQVHLSRPSSMKLPARPTPDPILQGEFDEKKLASVHKRLKRAIIDFTRAQCMWDTNVRKAVDLEDAIDNASNESRLWTSSIHPPREGKYAEVLSRLEWYWKVKYRQWVYRILSIICTLMSVMILFSEVTLLSGEDPNLSVFSHIIKSENISGPTVQFFAFLPLLYMVGCSAWSMFKMKLLSFYQMFPHQQTDSNSLTFNATIVCRFTPALCYNFLNLLHVTENTMFSKLMGDMDVIPFLGKKFNLIAPIFIFVMCLGTLTNVWGRLLTKLSIERFQFEEGIMVNETIDEGRELIKQDRILLEKKKRRDEFIKEVSDHRPSGQSETSESGGWRSRFLKGKELSAPTPNTGTQNTAVDKIRDFFKRSDGTSRPRSGTADLEKELGSLDAEIGL